MNKENLYEAMGNINEKRIHAAHAPVAKKKPVWVKWGTMAACLCFVLVFVGVTAPFLGGQDTIPVPTITIMNKDYTAPHMPVEELPVGYHYFRDLTGEEANDTGLEGCAIYVDPHDEDMSSIYIYQECGTPIDEYTVNNTQRQWAYVQWSVIE